MKPVKIRTNTRGSTRIPSTQRQNGKQLALIAAILFLIAAFISLYLAWEDLRGGGNTEFLV